MFKYFYTINCPEHEYELCKMEIKYIFGVELKHKYLFSDIYIDPSRSIFIKECISLIYTGDSLQHIVKQIEDDKLSYPKYKIRYIKHENDAVLYEDRLKANSIIGYSINGSADLHDPKIILGITQVEGQWLFGEFQRNFPVWIDHDKKPYFYCNSLGVRTSRSLVNIAVGNDTTCKLIDPCCGIGTVIIEALSLGFNIKGYEINPLIGENAKRNLQFFGYPDVITIGDMHKISEKFDTAIIDLPYGLFNPTTLKDQTDIMKTARKIANKMIIVTLEDMSEHIIAAGFQITDKCTVSKGKFIRYISICK